ncbi:MAG: 1,4-dihydroxy-2-naphthoate octaprenyltransferase [Firmicutes bacterium]|nr:1,4-dihydroxy-2-naphthoate octaprenyltransferase [Bacillota bacterium]MCL5040044.1 1,4-dihydroxy-2-naphthoate octaprenyltransferase [Bacillota bacterium]
MTWFMALRPFSWTASLVPVLLGASLAVRAGFALDLFRLLLTLVASVILQSATNLVSDYFDFRKGVDSLASYGSSRVLVGGQLKPRQVFWAGVFLFTLGSLLGVWLGYLAGWELLYFGLAALLGGYFYCGDPFGYKYRALGEALVFILMGPLMVGGSYYVQTGHIDLTPFVAALPVGFLVTAILYANNLRDIADDSQAGIRTLAILLGPERGRRLMRILVFGSYLSLFPLWAGGLLPWTTFLALASLPLALRLADLFRGEYSKGKLATADVRTAQLHLIFGLLLSLTAFVR